MTRDEILAMKAGHELNALIDEHVFKRIMCPIHHSLTCCGRGGGDWSGKIAAAWEVVEKMLELGFTYQAGCLIIERPNTSIPDQVVIYDWAFWKGWEAKGNADESAPLAICRAALLAVMETE